MNCILIIEDSKDIRENTAEILDMSGYKTMTAENGKKGVELAVKEKPDLIICDIMMPELDGYGVLHMLRKNPETKHIPFVFLTAKTERSDLRKGMEMGADDYITKPFEDIELLRAIEVRLNKIKVLDQKYAISQPEISRFLKDIKNSGFLDQLAEQYSVETYQKKQVLYTEGKRPRYLFYLVSGKVKASRTHEDGKEYITDILSEGDFIGYHAILEDSSYLENAVVLEEAEIMQIPKEDFLQMVYKDIAIAAKFIQILTQNVKEKEERLLSLAYSSLRKRVAKALVDIHGKFNAEGGTNPIGISRDDIARYTGTATESLIRTLSDFKEEKLILIREGKIVVMDNEKLKTLLY